MARMTAAKFCDTLTELNVKCTNNGEPISDHVLYRTLIGHLIYITMTRPNFSNVVQVVSQYVQSTSSLWKPSLQ